MKIFISFLIYLLVLVSGYAWHTTLENRALKYNLQELIEYISENGSESDDGIRD